MFSMYIKLLSDNKIDIGKKKFPVGTRFLRPFRPALGHTLLPMKWVPVVSRG